MKWFKHRKGYVKIRDKIQLETIDNETRNKLWSILIDCYFNKMREYSNLSYHSDSEILFRRLYFNYYKLPLDSLNYFPENLYKKTRDYFFEAEWYEIYSFIEAVIEYYPDNSVNQAFIKICNVILEEEKSGYRLVDKKFVEITSDVEISEIEDALQTPLNNVKVHLEQALNLLSDRKKPDYRNSIKESISAVEAICIKIIGHKMRTFQLLLNDVVKKINISRDLQQGFQNIFGWTSDESGIRHALMGDPNLSYEDAKFMLICCSAFINYLTVKATKVGIKLE